MNLGIYIDNLNNTDQLRCAGECIKNGLRNKQLSDASIFYDEIAYNPFDIPCGFFNSTDLWNFSGSLVTTSIDSTITSLKIINNFDIYYYYGWEDIKQINIFALIELVQRKKIPVICKNEESYNNLYRLTNVKPLGISSDFSDIINIINGNKDERRQNYQNVCI